MIKRAMNLEKGRVWEVSGGGKGKEKFYNYIIISKIK